MTGQSLLEGAVGESKEQTWLLCKNRVNNNSGTLTVPVTFMAGARGEHVGKGIRVCGEEGKSRKRARTTPKHAKNRRKEW